MECYVYSLLSSVGGFKSIMPVVQRVSRLISQQVRIRCTVLCEEDWGWLVCSVRVCEDWG